jgi:hypothetical protein
MVCLGCARVQLHGVQSEKLAPLSFPSSVLTSPLYLKEVGMDLGDCMVLQAEERQEYAVY